MDTIQMLIKSVASEIDTLRLAGYCPSGQTLDYTLSHWERSLRDASDLIDQIRENGDEPIT